MGTIEVFPDLLVKESGPKTLVGGASATAVLSDLSDASYIRAAGATPPGYAATLRMGPLTAVPAGAVITRVQLKMRYSHFGSAPSAYEKWVPQTVLVGRQSGSSHVFSGFTTGEPVPGYSLSTSPQSWTGPYRAQTWDGKAWLHTLLQASGARLYAQVVTSRNWAFSTARIYSASVIVHYDERPTVTLTAPTGSVPVSRPTFLWSMSDPEGSPQAVYRAKVYTAATAALSGFSPDSAAFRPVYDSGDQFSAETLHTASDSIAPNGSYVAYLRAATGTVAGVRPWSPWVSQPFTLATTGPLAPTVAATYDPSANAVLVTVTGRDNMLTWELSSFEPATPYDPPWAIGTNTSAARSTAQAAHAVASLQLTRTGSTGSVQVSMPAGTPAGVPVKPGQQYQGRASFRAATTGRTCQLGLVWLNASGTTLSTTLGGTVTDNTSGWVEATVTATAPAGAARARLQVTVSSAASGESHYVDKAGVFVGTATAWNRGGFGGAGRVTHLERSLDAGATWSPVARYAYSETEGVQLFTFPDYGTPGGATATYRGRAEAPNEDGDLVLSDWSATASAAMPQFTEWWLRDLVDPSMSMELHAAAFSEQDAKPAAVDYPLGSDAAVMTHDGVKAGPLAVRVFLLDRAAYDKFRAILRLGRTLLLQDTSGQQWYVQSSGGTKYDRLVAHPTASEATPTRHAHEVEVEFVQVEPPTSAALAG